eukprot:2371663-Prymnesium_polylepis.1
MPHSHPACALPITTPRAPPRHAPCLWHCVRAGIGMPCPPLFVWPVVLAASPGLDLTVAVDSIVHGGIEQLAVHPYGNYAVQARARTL